MKLFIVLIGLFLLAAFSPSKDLTATGSIEQWQELLNVVDQSNASHQQVTKVQQWLIPQLQKQAADTTKKK